MEFVNLSNLGISCDHGFVSVHYPACKKDYCDCQKGDNELRQLNCDFESVKDIWEKVVFVKSGSIIVADHFTPFHCSWRFSSSISLILSIFIMDYRSFFQSNIHFNIRILLIAGLILVLIMFRRNTILGVKPGAKIDHFTAFAAEGSMGIVFKFSCSAAFGTFDFHCIYSVSKAVTEPRL